LDYQIIKISITRFNNTGLGTNYSPASNNSLSRLKLTNYQIHDSTITRFNDYTIQRLHDSTITRFNDYTIKKNREMKKLLSIILLVIITNAHAQFWKDDIKGNRQVVTKTRSIGHFDQVTITGSFDVLLVKGEPGALQLETDENLHEVVETTVKNNKLVIKINSKYNVKRYTKLHIVLPVKYLEKITITGSATVQSKNTFDWQNIKLNLLGSGNINLDLHSNKVWATVTGSGDIELSGKIEDINYKVTGSGSIVGKKVDSNYGKASVTGSGDIYLKAPTKNLKATVTGSGSIYYYGTPEQITSKALGSGEVIQK